MKRIIEIGLVSGVTVAILAFGGTEAPYFSVVEVLLLGLAILLLAGHGTSLAGYPRLPITIPVSLVVLVLLQCVHLPGPAGAVFAYTTNPLDSAPFSGISVAPYETLSGFLAWVTYLAAFYLTIVVYRQPHGGKRLMFALLGLGTFEACDGLFQYLTGWQQIFSYTKTVNLEMATGTYINYDHFAGLLEMTFPFALACACDQFRKIPQSHANLWRRLRMVLVREEAQKLVLWLFLTIVLLLAIVFSESRMGLISAVISALLLLILVATSGWRRTSAGALILALLAAGLSMAVWIGPDPVIARFETLGQQSAAPSDTRWAIWKDTLGLIEDHPWFGTGLGTFPIAYPSVQTAFAGRFVSHAHNDYLEFASELGIPGVLLLFGAVFYLLLQSARSFRRIENGFGRTVALGCFGSILGILLHSLTDFNLHIPANALVFVVVLGLAYANSWRRCAVACPSFAAPQP
jgi:O-antigen ligase